MPESKKQYVQDLRKASELVKGLLQEDQDFGAGCIRLCIHDAFAFDVKKRVYGVNASIRTQKELSHKGNEGLDEIVARLANIKSLLPSISFADLYQLAGIEAIASRGGPQIPFTPGRKDGWTFPPQAAYLLLAKGDQPLRQYKEWIERTGLPLQSAVALLGVHSIAPWWSEQSNTKSKEALTKSTGSFDNSYFQRLLDQESNEDVWLLEDNEIRRLVEQYASDKEGFFKDYSEAHEHLSLLGTNLSADPVDLSIINAAPEYVITASEYALYAAGAVAASGAIVYGLWKWRRKYVQSSKLFC